MEYSLGVVKERSKICPKSSHWEIPNISLFCNRIYIYRKFLKTHRELLIDMSKDFLGFEDVFEKTAL